MDQKLEKIARDAVDAGVKLHTRLGPGLLESVYEAMMARELVLRGHMIQRQKPVPIKIDNLQFSEGFRADLVVDDALIIEIKSVESLSPVHGKQLLTYLRLAQMRLGLLMNFGGITMRDSIKRVAN